MKFMTILPLVLAAAASALGQDRYPGGMPGTPVTELPFLQAALEEGDWNKRIHAVNRIGSMGAPGLPALRFAAGDADWQVRLTAVHWLGRLGTPAIPGLTHSLLSDSCRVIRITAIHWLGSMGPQALKSLEAAVQDESDVARISGWYWLRRLNPKKYANKPPLTSPAEELNVCIRSPLPLGTRTVVSHRDNRRQIQVIFL